MRMTATRWKVALVAAAGAIVVLAALTARAVGVFGCQAGPADPALTLFQPPYAQTHWHAIRMCVRGGGCAIRPVVIVDMTESLPGPNGKQVRVPRVKAMEFGGLIPARVARLGPDGGPVQLTVTAYGPSRAILSASATLSPIRQPPASRCELRGYTIIAQLTPNGSLGYFQVS